MRAVNVPPKYSTTIPLTILGSLPHPPTPPLPIEYINLLEGTVYSIKYFGLVHKRHLMPTKAFKIPPKYPTTIPNTAPTSPPHTRKPSIPSHYSSGMPASFFHLCYGSVLRGQN